MGENPDQNSLAIAQWIKARYWALAVVVFVLAIVGFLLPRYQPYFFSFEHGHADLRTRVLSQSQSQQYNKVIFVKITEFEMEEMTYRSPIDRAWLADLLIKLDAQNPSVIALDILIDQPTEPDKDARLIDTIKSIDTPVVLANADDRFPRTERQKAYNADFISQSGALSGFVNITADEDDIIRELPVSSGVTFPHSFADTVVEAATGQIPPKPAFKERIAWLKDLDQKTPAIAEKPAIFVRDIPEKAGLEGRIVLVGADLPGTDKHKTPFAGQGRVKKGTSGSRILAQIIAQRLDGRRVTMLPAIQEFILYLIAALAGLLIAASPKALTQKARVLSFLGTGAILVDVIFFKVFSVLVPTAMILFVTGLAVGLPALYVKLRGWYLMFRSKQGKNK